MLINVKDKSALLPKSKLPRGFRQLGRVTFGGMKTGPLLYEEQTGDFFGVFRAGPERLDRPEVLVLLGLVYVNSRIAAQNRKPPVRRLTSLQIQKMQEGSRRARERRTAQALRRIEKRSKEREVKK